eukprot:8906081-Heterocapsa_arctica.AAC.1
MPCTSWVLDSGTANDLTGRLNLPDGASPVYELPHGPRLDTANGIIITRDRCDVELPASAGFEISP